MTEKRFTKCDTKIRDNGEEMTQAEVRDMLNKLHEDNELLQKELKVYREVANCSNCKYQNYDWYDDGDEFEICEKGNNNQQIEYHICKEWEEF